MRNLMSNGRVPKKPVKQHSSAHDPISAIRARQLILEHRCQLKKQLGSS